MRAVLLVTEGSLKGLTARGRGGGSKKVTMPARNLRKMRQTSHLVSPSYAGAWRSFIMSFGLSSTSAPMGMSISGRSEEHTSELQSLMRISYAVFCLKKKKTLTNIYTFV